MNTLIVIKATEARSLTSIARDCAVSPTTVRREINQAAKLFKPQYQVFLVAILNPVLNKNNHTRKEHHATLKSKVFHLILKCVLSFLEHLIARAEDPIGAWFSR